MPEAGVARRSRGVPIAGGPAARPRDAAGSYHSDGEAALGMACMAPRACACLACPAHSRLFGSAARRRGCTAFAFVVLVRSGLTSRSSARPLHIHAWRTCGLAPEVPRLKLWHLMTWISWISSPQRPSRVGKVRVWLAEAHGMYAAC